MGRGNDINVDPRERFVQGEFDKSQICNVFLDFYHRLVQALFDEGVTANVFCVCSSSAEPSAAPPRSPTIEVGRCSPGTVAAATPVAGLQA